MKQPLIKPRAFTNDPKKAPEVIKDVYHEDVLKPTNAITDNTPAKKATMDYLASTKLSSDEIIPTITKGIGSDSDGITYDYGVVKKRVDKAFGIDANSNGISTKQKNEIGKALATTTGTKQSRVVFNNTVRFLESGKEVMNATDITDFINGISKQDEVFKLLDLEAQSAVVKSISDKIIDWQVPGLVDKLLNSVTDSKLKNQLLEENAINASRRGLLGMTQHLCSKMGQSRAFIIHRQLIINLMSFIKRDEETSPATLGGNLLEFFKWLSPVWDKDPYDETLDCLEFYTYANPVAVEALATTEVYTLALLGSQVDIERPSVTATRLFQNRVQF